MKFSILTKMLAITGATLFCGAFILTIYIYETQVNLINTIQLNQKEYINNQLNRTEKESIEEEDKRLKQLVSILSGSMGNALYALDTQAAKDTIATIYKEDNIKAIIVYDKLSQNNFLVKIKEKGYKNLPSIKNNLKYENEIIGTLEIFYDNSFIIQKINELKNKDLANFEQETKTTSTILKDGLQEQIIWFVMWSLLIMFLLAFSLSRFVNKPLQKFKNGLESFFKFLEDSSNSVEKIDIQSNDEFGAMSQSTNESINVSMKLHSEITHLMGIMNKNIITSETDDNGIITYVSDAFCTISGYTRDELIGKSHKILRHPDMEKEVFKDLWETIKANKVWKGEIKNRKKDGGYYWVDAIITPKCMQNGVSCGYTAIRQDITAKKEVEELSAQQTVQLAAIERSNRLLNGRESRMIELKEQINQCKIQLGEEPPFSVLNNDETIIVEAMEVDATEEFDLRILLNVEELQSMMESFYKIMHIPLAIIDLEANILVSSKWQRSCTDFHRANEESCKRCIESDIDLANKLDSGERYTSYKCQNGLIDCASPIIINDKHVANFFIGQFLINEPDMEFFTAQGKFFGYDLEDYLASVRDIPVIKEDMLPFIMQFLIGITDVITSISIEKLKAQKQEAIIKQRAIQMQKGQLAAMNLAEDAEKARLEVENYKKHLEELIEERTEELHDQKNFINSVMNTQQNFVITSDGKCLRTANKALLDFYNVSNVEEFIANYGDCICDTFDTTASSEYIQKQMGDEIWTDYIYNRPSIIHKTKIQKDGISYIFTITTDKLIFNNEEIKTAVFTDITELERTREEVEKILANILLPVLITSKVKRTILYANKYAEIQYEKKVDEIIGSNIDDIYTIKGQHYHIIDAIRNFGKVENIEETFKTATGKEFTALLSVTPIMYNNEESYIGMVTDITKQKAMENEVRAIHKHTRESIEYAALIQHALIPSNDLFREYFSDYLTIWHPKDIVGGDIYLFEELRNKDECLLMVVDCTGHGVPGAFVTMLVKAIERQIVSNIIFGQDDVSPAKILSIFNKTMKHLLKQEDENSISNAGFDGGILYYNKKDKIIKYAGAETPLFYIENGELTTIKGSRHSVGYKKSDGSFEFKEHTIEVKEGMSFYLTTDGYLDQNGGVKGFPFGKSRFSEIITTNANESLADAQEVLLNSLLEYQKDEERNDDVTIIGFKI